MSRGILLTGASGFIGQLLAKSFLSSGYKVTALGMGEILNPDIKSIKLDAYTAESLANIEEEIPEGLDVIIHAGAYGVRAKERAPSEFFCSNISYSQALLDLAVKKDIKTFISIGSVSEYEEPIAGQLICETAGLTSHLYGASKAAFGIWGLAYARSQGINFIHFRLFNVYGIGERDERLLPYLIQSLCKGEEVKLTSGEQVRDFLYIDDFIVLIGLVLEDKTGKNHSGIYNVCSGKPLRVKDFIYEVCDVLGRPVELLKLGAVNHRADETMWAVGDNSLVKSAFNWEPKISTLEGVSKMVNFYGSDLSDD